MAVCVGQSIAVNIEEEEGEASGEGAERDVGGLVGVSVLRIASSDLLISVAS